MPTTPVSLGPQSVVVLAESRGQGRQNACGLSAGGPKPCALRIEDSAIRDFYRNQLARERLSLFVTLVDELMLPDPDLEQARFEILDFSASKTGKPRELTIVWGLGGDSQ